VIIKEFGAIDYVDFSPIEPYNFAATCSLRVQVYNPLTKLVLKNITTFQREAFGASYRRDGQLIVAGDAEGKVRLFDANSKTILRIFSGHRAAVHRTYFASDLHHIASFSDDKTVKLWDVGTEKVTCTFREHNDYVRAGAVNPASPHTILSGSYDHIVKMYDTRSQKCVLSMNHGSPVESLIFFPTGAIYASAGGNDIKFWDAVAGGRLLGTISQHTKTVTCLSMSDDGRHLISGSLDRHVKFFNTANYQLIHNINYTNSVLSVGVAKDGNTLVVGQVDGTLAIHRREQKFNKVKVERAEREKRRKERNYKLAVEVIDKPDFNRMKNFDVSLRKFEYTRALDQVLSRQCVTKTPEVTVAIIHELIRRNGLKQALANREQNSLAKILTFFNKYMGDSRFTRILLDAINIFLDVYEPQFMSLTPEIQKIIIELNRRVQLEESMSLEFLKLQGALDIITNAAEIVSERQNETIDLTEEPTKIQPSSNAAKATVINV
jgi:U3 small nucleolar RNA-associated protein 15